jgi:hypothetical protein
MTIFALIGAKALYLLFIWLLSTAIASWLSDRKGYGERLGLTFGLLLSLIGLVIVLLLPGRPGSKWKVEGWIPRKGRGGGAGGQLIAAGDSPGIGDPPREDLGNDPLEGP